jgi:hypothetical protein
VAREVDGRPLDDDWGLAFQLPDELREGHVLIFGGLRDERDRNQALLFGSMVVLGIIVTHVALGLIAGLGGAWGQSCSADGGA